MVLKVVPRQESWTLSGGDRLGWLGWFTEVAAERCREVDRLVRPDLVVEAPEGFGLFGQLERVGDLEPIQLLLSEPLKRSTTRLVSGAWWRVRTWASSGRPAMKPPEDAERQLARVVRETAIRTELTPGAEAWAEESPAFAPRGRLKRFLAGRSSKPGLPSGRPLREGDVFWVILPIELPPGTSTSDQTAQIAFDAYDKLGADVWDVTAAARQAAKRAYHEALKRSALYCLHVSSRCGADQWHREYFRPPDGDSVGGALIDARRFVRSP